MTMLSILAQADIFYDLTPAQLELIASICEEQRCRVGETVFAENSPSQDMYIIAQGEVEIRIDPKLVTDTPADADMPPVTIATVRPGQVFGEIALVDQGFRSAGAHVSQHDTRLIVIGRDRLMALCDAHPDLGYRVMRNLAADLSLKLRSTDIEMRAQLARRPREIDGPGPAR